MTRDNRPHNASIPAVGFCEEKHRLIREFLDAIHELNAVQKEQTQAVIEGDPMQLTRIEKERISNSRHKIQSVAESLSHVDPKKVEDFEGIQDCLEGADKNLGKALRSSDTPDPGQKKK